MEYKRMLKGQPDSLPYFWAWKAVQYPHKPMKWHLGHICDGFVRKTGSLFIFWGFDICDVTLSDLCGSWWPLIEFLSPEMISASPKPPKTTNWTYLRGFREKNWTPGLFSRIWPMWQDLERPLWVRMTSNWIFKSRNGFSIPKTPQNDYLNISEMFSGGKIGKLVQKFVQKTVKMRKSKNWNYKKTVH